MGVDLPAPHVSVSVSVDGASGVGRAGHLAIELAEALQLSAPDIARVERVVTEAATNIVQHAEGGEILLRPIAVEASASLEVLALDRGPGMANVAHALQDGISTTGSSGLGLGVIARLSTCFEVSSAPGKGTALLARIGRVAKRSNEATLEWGVVCVAKLDEKVCGDAWAVTAGHGRNTVLIVDGLGHGLLAFEAAQQALRVFGEQAGTRPEASLQVLHDAMHGTRGAAAAIAEIDWRGRKLRYAGAGNIVGALVPVEGAASNMVSYNGTLGKEISRFQDFTYPWPDQGLLILHSDGLSSQWDLEPYPGLTRKDPSLIAGVLYRDFANRRDDVVVLVGRERERNTPHQDGDAM